IYSLLTIYFRANLVVIGMAINIFAEGITTTMYRTIFGMSEGSSKVAAFDKVGPLLLPVYIGLVLVAVVHVIFGRTKIGLKIKGAGEYPQALDSMGISVNRVRWLSVIIGSAIIGFGGAFLSIGELSFFTENMVSGRGYIALAAVIFGRYTPIGVLLAVLLFGAGEAAVYRFSAMGLGIPSQFILMIPYILTLIVVAFFGHKGAGPKALGIPFSKEEQ
ncbi:MAG: ABC transporter permease, partial [Lachnospiraceae bacterium]|nr:ABC transporter permease [Lachnospiraceae bacterium]